MRERRLIAQIERLEDRIGVARANNQDPSRLFEQKGKHEARLFTVQIGLDWAGVVLGPAKARVPGKRKSPVPEWTPEDLKFLREVGVRVDKRQSYPPFTSGCLPPPIQEIVDAVSAVITAPRVTFTAEDIRLLSEMRIATEDPRPLRKRPIPRARC